ncbi:MAG: transporter substrate-binding domain-containing protein [Opitutae bacterium]|nr:transporter substrate-binding domain-containing protein [Opitutae bacterium]
MTPAAPPGPTVEFTPAERAWIAAHPVIRVGHDPAYAPYSFLDARGELTGIDLSYLEIVARHTGLRFQNETRQNWMQLLAAFRAGEVDMLMSLSHTPERDATMLFTHNYSLSPVVVVTRADADYIFDPRELTGRRVGLVRGYAGMRRAFEENVVGAQVVEYDRVGAVLEALARGDIEAGVAGLHSAAYLVRTLRLTNLRLGGVFAESPSNSMGVRKSLPELVGIIDKVLDQLDPAERRRINNRWVGLEMPAPSWWARAGFRISAGFAVAAVFILLLVWLHNRRLQSELAQRRVIQAELEATRDRLGRVSEEKSELLRMVAHDLRSPLTGILLGTDLLKMMDPAEGKARYDETLGQIRTTTAQMIRLTDDLVDADMLEEGRRVYAAAELDLAALLRETVGAFAETAARKDLRLSLETEAAVPPVRSDARALRQVGDNLVSNALKYSPPHAAVVVALRRTADGVQFSVRDQGPGLSAEECRKVFQKFVQGSAKPTGGEKSTGLGLWIVQRIVDGLHGRVWCESKLGQGATFLVELPLAPPPTG